jgi:hypothetical protein
LRYSGDYQNGKRHGQGKLSENGNSYEGGFSLGTYHGKGLWQKRNGDFYEGEFKEGGFHQGQAKWTKMSTDKDGTRRVEFEYEGGLKAIPTKENPRGKLTFDGEGVLKKFKKFITNTNTSEGNGEPYSDPLKQNTKSEPKSEPTYDLYTGTFLNGKYHGHGRLQKANGDVYEGPFVQGE